MIYFNFTIRNPWCNKFENVVAKGGSLFKNKAWEFEIYRSDTIAEFETRITVNEDHAGIMFGLGLLSWTVNAQFYDTRHWNYEKNQWEVYPDNG
jgi:hypothetical protein